MENSVKYLAPRVALGACLLGLICIYFIYYLLFNVTRPRVVCKDERRLEALRQHCPALFERYWPALWAPQGHMQSIIRLLTQWAPSVESLRGRRETIRMSDGGHVCLDWFHEKQSLEEEGGSGDHGDPILLILCGVTGSSKETYVRHWIHECRGLGYRCVVFNYRGCGKSKISTPRLFSLGNVEDLVEVAEYIHSNNPTSPIVAVGVSMASVQLMRYVAECRRKARPCRISAGLVFSVIWNIRKTHEALHNSLFNRHVFSRFLTRRYTNIIKENRQVFEEYESRNELEFDYKKALQSNNLKELNDTCVVPMFQYHTEPLQQSHSPCENVGELTIPVIAINAADDPFCPVDAIPEEEARRNPNLILVTTRRGGHIGFMQEPFLFYKTYMDRVLRQFLVGVLKHDCLSSPSSSSSPSPSSSSPSSSSPSSSSPSPSSSSACGEENCAFLNDCELEKHALLS